jgi:glycosyltransferase involved in cell wall biosynthesis
VKVLHVVAAVSRDLTDPAAILAQRRPLTEQVEALAAAGVENIVLQVAGRDATLVRNGVQYRFVADRWPARAVIHLPLRVRWIPAFGRLARALRPDVIHVHGLANSWQIVALKRRVPRVPMLAQDRATRPERGVRGVLQRWAFARTDAVAFATREQAAPFRDAGLLRADVPVFEVIAGSCEFTPGDRTAARARSSLRGDPCLLWVGHLTDNKDPLTMLDAVARAVPELPDAQLWCCFGRAPLRERVEARIAADPRLRGRVHLLGFRPREELEAFYRAADFLVLGSRREGCPWVCIEALACGTPVVATAIAPIRAITAGDTAGCLFPPGDAAAAARCLIDIRTRDSATLRASAREQFDRKLSWPAIAEQLIAAYRSLIDRTRPGDSA